MENRIGNAGRVNRSWEAARAALGVMAGAALLALGPATAAAGLAESLPPGGSSLLDGTIYQTPTGTVVAKSVVPFSVRYQPDEGTFADFSGTATGQLRDTVLRDPATGRLTFVYHISLDNEEVSSAAEGSTLTIGGFGPYRTAVAGTLEFQQVAPIQRSADGSTLRFSSGAPGLGGPPELAVSTDAAKFDAGGSVNYALADEFRVNGPRGQELDTVWGQVTIKGAFRPTALFPSGPGGSTGGPTAVPLPPAFFTGMGVLAACAIISVCRRSLTRDK